MLNATIASSGDRATNVRTLELESPRVCRRLIGERPRFRNLERDLDVVARSPKPVLILGERGSGRSLVAERIASSGVRATAPYLVVDCAQPATTLKRELFGDEGSRGKIAYAEQRGGTLVIDDFDRAPASLGATILGAAFQRLRRDSGATIVAGSARFVFIGDASPDGGDPTGSRALFGAEGLTIKTPAFRELTANDLRAIIEAEAERARSVVGNNARLGRTAALAIVKASTSVGELAAIVDAAIAAGRDGEVLSADEVDAAIYRTRSRRVGSSASARTFDQIRKDALRDALDACEGSRTRAARLLGVSPKTVYNWVKEDRLR